MQRRRSAPNNQRIVALVGLVVTVAGLYLARDLLIPFALAALVSFLLAPVVSWLERRHVHRIAGVLLIGTLCLTGIGVLGYVVAQQALEFTLNLPEYRENIRSRLDALRPDPDSAIGKAAESIEKIAKEEGAEAEEAEADPSEQDPVEDEEQEPEPVPVEVRERPRTPLEWLMSAAPSLLAQLALVGMVFVLVAFMLLAREDLRDRCIHLAGRNDLHVTTQAIGDAGRRVGRYLAAQLLVNTIYAVPVTIALFLIGVPNAILWGTLGLLIRFVPYFGPLIAAAMPIALSLAVFEDWTNILLVVGLYVVVEVIINNVVEPWLYGSSTGMSSLAVIVSALFWTWLWGPLGLLLATPISATLVAFGKQVPQLRFLAVLLGDDPVGSPAERFYQRLLAMDQEEASELAEEAFEERGSAVAVLDSMVLPAMKLCEEDVHARRLDEARAEYVRDSVEAITPMLLESEQESEKSDVTTGRHAAEPGPKILCLPVRDEADSLLARMLTEVAAAHGYEVESTPIAGLVSDQITAVEKHEPSAVYLSALPPSATAHARHLYKRLKARFPELRVCICLWLSTVPDSRARQRIGCAHHEPIIKTFEEALRELQRVAAPGQPVGAAAAATE